jgi:beta-galactosidase/beta-glucuronidase
MPKRQSSKRSPRPHGTRHGYPRPQLVREDFISLDGPWEFAIDPEGDASQEGIRFKQQITVPFAPETQASGIGQSGFFNACWYRRTVDVPRLLTNQRVILHFGAVDYQATVWVNGKLAVRHEGGYTPFSADITDLLVAGRQQTIVVRAEDDPHDLAKPRGKQDWKLEPHSIWYYRTTGIWQSVWMERVNGTHIRSVKWTPNIEHWQIALHARIEGPQSEDTRLRVRLRAHGRTRAEDVYRVGAGGDVQRIIQLPDPGIEDQRCELLWSVSSPNLIDVDLELLDADGNVIDSATSYVGMRAIHVSGRHVLLNGRPLTQRLVLDQGYWPDGGLTAPDDEAYRRDVELVKAMGFNGVRKHQKIESPRFLYWADRLGLLVWEEMPSVYTFSDEGMRRLTRQWMEAIERDHSHPCIITWVPFNESWGVPDLPRVEAQRHAVQALYHLTKMLDATRPVISNDGWEATDSDLLGIHDYDANPKSIRRRYEGDELQDILHVLEHERPGHRILLLEEFEYGGQPLILTEFGGIAFSREGNGTWGYSRAGTPDELAAQYLNLLSAVRSLPMFSGYCYTQFTDTYQEANGLLYMDRTPKFALEEIACATRGPRTPEDQEVFDRWKERLMAIQND